LGGEADGGGTKKTTALSHKQLDVDAIVSLVGMWRGLAISSSVVCFNGTLYR